MYSKMIKMAIEAKEKSYSPYSNFRVGACVKMSDGSYYTGCNIENGAFSPTVCAERVAIFKAVSEGKREITALCVAADRDNTYPCGVCRQVIVEFSKDAEIIVANSAEDYSVYSVSELLPKSFSLEE